MNLEEKHTYDRKWYVAKRQNNPKWRAENKRRAKAWRKANAERVRKYKLARRIEQQMGAGA